jgi:hypothetical protein
MNVKTGIITLAALVSLNLGGCKTTPDPLTVDTKMLETVQYEKGSSMTEINKGYLFIYCDGSDFEGPADAFRAVVYNGAEISKYNQKHHVKLRCTDLGDHYEPNEGLWCSRKYCHR